MATTRIISMHVSHGKTIADCLTDRIDYSKNPDKTQGGELISAYECDPKTADAEFLFSKRQYQTITGREQRHDVIAYQVRQSFKPGEITPEEANRVGYEFAERFLKGRHAFFVATHTDKKHIHNHIIWNSTTLDCKHKFRDFLGSGRAVARLSDAICTEHRLSVIADPKRGKNHYGKWLGDNAKPTHRELLCGLIDAALLQKPDSFDVLLKLLAARGSLSVQVHPDDEYAKAHENKLGKTEAWVILHAEEGASLLYGIREGVTIDDLRRALTGGEDVEPLIQRVPVKAGDVFYMPAGMVHAIGAGILLCEVQQSSNVTYRLYDYGRKDRYGQLRQLHLDKALDVLDTTARPQILEAQENEEGRARLCACKYFSVERQRVCGKTALAGDDASFTALMFLEGRGTVQAEDTTLSWKSADCFFVPAGRRPILLEGEGTLLVVRL